MGAGAAHLPARRHSVWRFSSPRAFSLVELLTVIAIIGVLSALLLLAIAHAKARAQRAVCLNNVRQLGIALRAFVADNGVYVLEGNPGYRQGAYPEHLTMWSTALQLTELSGSGSSTNRIPFAQWASQTVWKCPAANKPSSWPTNSGAFFSYGYNVQGTSARTDTNSLGLGGQYVWSAARYPAPPVAESAVVNPSEMMAIGDGFKGGPGVIEDGDNWLWRSAGVTGYAGSTAHASARHQGKAEVVFCDGHVESPTLRFLFEDPSDAALVRWNRDHLPH
jgi:prepilin-type N-terminal cleavage/methylation domain-containing protein/prepilin-type processing-associated H-X9-DG protein